MSESQREAIRSNAKYLRNVRPIDPEEIADYVEGGVHPAVVRRVLREEALALDIVETDEGTFIPVPEGPVRVAFDGVDQFPRRFETEVDEILFEAFGPDWPTDDAGDRLRTVIRRLKEEYYRGRDVTYDREVALGYAIYHLPDYYAVVQYVLEELATADLLPHRLRVLDVGAGVGGPALGLAAFLPQDALVDYHAVEPSPAAEILDTLLEATGPNFHATVHRTTAEDFDPSGTYDLLLFANVLSELDDPVEVVRRYVPFLAPSGSLLALAPADRETAIGLREVERDLVERPKSAPDAGHAVDLNVYSPTVRLWPGATPSDRCWSFVTRPDLAVPTFQRDLDRAADGAGDRAGGGEGEFVNVDVQYAYAILRRDGQTRVTFRPSPKRYARLADSTDHVTERVNCAAVKLSGDLGEANPLYLVGDGSQHDDHFAVLTRETGLNRALREAAYGAALSFEGTLVLWNDDEEAFNLVVDAETVVDRLR